LLFQAVLVVAGALAVASLARRKLDSNVAGVTMAIVYVLAIDMQNAVMFDWNPTTCGAGLLPWIAWGFERRRPVVFALATLGVALCKENLVLWALALCLALALPGPRLREPPLPRRYALVAAVVLAGLFVVELRLVWPLLRPEGFRHLRYEEVGSNLGEIAGSLLARPGHALALLVRPEDKLAGLLAPLASVAFTALLAPRYLVALTPMALERFWSTHANRWWGYHYGAGMSVIAVLAAIDGVAWLSARQGRNPINSSAASNRTAAERASLGLALTAVMLSCLTVGFGARGEVPPLWRWRQGYPEQDRRDAEAALAVIPAGASVQAQNHLLAHLGARHHLRELGRPMEAEFVALHLGQGAWPFADTYPAQLARELLASGYGIAACEGRAVVLARGAPIRPCPAIEAPVSSVTRSARGGGL
jgi:hypothetical protein